MEVGEEAGEFTMWFSLNLPQIHLVSLSTEVFFGRPEDEQQAMLDWLIADLDAVDRDAVAERTSALLPVMTRAQLAKEQLAAAEGDGEPPSKRGTGELVADHVKYWPLFRMWVCQWCNRNFTWIFDTFPDARAKFKKAVKMAFISLADMNSAV